MTTPRTPQHPVGSARTEEAERQVAAEARVQERRTGRRLALVAIGIAVLLTTTFCGTGVVVNVQRGRERALWFTFQSAQADYDCCYRVDTDGTCAEATRALSTLHRLQQRTSGAARVAAWFHSVIGIEPMLWDVPTPAPADVERMRAACAALPHR